MSVLFENEETVNSLCVSLFRATQNERTRVCLHGYIDRLLLVHEQIIS